MSRTITKPEVIEALSAAAVRLDGTFNAVKRKRNLRESEKIMWLADLRKQHQLIRAAIKLLEQ